MSSSVEGDDQGAGRSPAVQGPMVQAGRSRWWVTVAVFVTGMVVGVLTVGLLNATTPDFLAQAPGATETTSGSGPGGPGSVPVTAEARVNAACLRVINEAQDVSTILTGVDDAVTDVDLQQLDDIVRQLQPLQPRLQRDLLDCRVDTGLVTGPDPGSNPTPAPPTPASTDPTPSGTR